MRLFMDMGLGLKPPPPKHENIRKLEFSLGLGTDLTVCHSLSKTGLWSCIFSLPLLLLWARRGACGRSHVQHKDNIESAKLTINEPHKWPIRKKWHRTVPLGPAKSSDWKFSHVCTSPHDEAHAFRASGTTSLD